MTFLESPFTCKKIKKKYKRLPGFKKQQDIRKNYELTNKNKDKKF